MLNFYKLHSDPNQLNGYKDAHLKIPEIAWEVADTNEKKQELEHLWARYLEYAYWYACDVIKKPWLLGEKVISSDPKYAYWYAREVIKNPWEPGEKAIASDSAYAYMYARDVIKNPWEPGEKVIARSSYHAFWYAFRIIKNPWEPGEKAIADNPEWKQYYEEHFKVKL